MANQVLLKKSSVGAKVPLTTDLAYGELALNYTDGKLYYKTASNTIDAHSSDTSTATLSNKTLTTPSVTGLASFTTTTAANAVNITYNPSSTAGAALFLTGKDAQGGVGYFDFLKVTNTTSGATNPSKSFRVNSTGNLEIVNSAYTSTILSLTDTGTLTPLTINAGGTVGTAGQILSSTGTGLQWITPASGGGATIQVIAGDTGTDNVTLGTDTLTFVGGTGITSAVTDNTVTMDIDSTVATLTGTQTLTNKTLTSPVISTITNTGTITLPTTTGTLALQADVHYIGTTSVALNRASANLALTGISSVTLPGSVSGTVQIIPTSAVGTGTVLTIPATTGTIVTTGDSATVTNTMLAGSIANAKLTNSSVTVGTTAISLGASSTTLAGLSSVTSTSFVGALTGNADTATSAGKWTTARNLAGNSVDGSAAVAFANKFIVQGTTDTGLSGAQFLGSLGTGIVKNTTTTGVLSIAVAGDFPTLNQSTTGSAATLTTPRAIYGNNFDGSAALTQIITSTYGGTGNGFTKFSGPATTEKTFTLPNASANILTDNALVTPAQGGTGVNNGSNTLTLAGNVSHAGAFTQTFTATANTSITLPTTGTLATLAGSEALTNKTVNGLTVTTTTGTLTLVNGSTLATSGAFSTTLTATAATNVTLPTTGTLATLAGTETLTNKSLTSPTVTGTQNNNSILYDTTFSATGITTATAAHTFAVATYRSAEYTFQITNGTWYKLVKALVVHNGTTVSFSSNYDNSVEVFAAATTALTTVVITGTAGQFSCATTTLAVGGTLTISGTLAGTGSITGYTSPKTYYITATNGTTTFTLSDVFGGTALTTTAGTPTGLTYTYTPPPNTTYTFDVSGGNVRLLVTATSGTASVKGMARMIAV